MKVREIMTTNPTCCSADTRLQEVAQQMVACDCGMIPIVDDDDRPLGTVTDRDIVCRGLAEGKNPLELTAKEVMTRPAVTISADAGIEDLAHVLEEQQLRRVIVTGQDGRCVGIVAQADLARQISGETIAEVLREVSRSEGQPRHAN